LRGKNKNHVTDKILSPTILPLAFNPYNQYRSALPTFAQTGIPDGSMSQCDTQMQTFLTNYQIPGATFALPKTAS
jgi:hypothetical protein